MYAVIETGGKQYRVELGTELAVERLDAEPGTSITLDRVLLVADGEEAAIGRPLVADAAVAADVVAQDRADKVIVFKYRPKARSRVKKGHRQERTVLRVSDIRFNGRSAAEDAERSRLEAKTERQRLEEAAARQAAEDAALAARLAERSAPPAATPTKGRARKTAVEPKTSAEPKATAATATPADTTTATPADTTTATTEPATTAPKATRASRAKGANAADSGALDTGSPAREATEATSVTPASTETGTPEASGPEATPASATAPAAEPGPTPAVGDEATPSPAETEKDE
jgi:large subunit ribosomal protein L21